MGTGAGRGSWRGALATALCATAVLALAACGSENFANDPRPASPIQVAAKIDANKVSVSPNNFGAGLVTFTVNNFSRSRVRFELSGPKRASSDEIKPGQPGSLKIELPEGDYRATAAGETGAQPATFTVGGKRAGSQNRLLLP